jgi:hypothetical protein
LVQKNGHHKKIRHYKKTVTIKLKSDTMVSSNGVKGGVVTPNGEKKGLRNALSTLLMSRMTCMRSWKSHRLTSHTWLGLIPEIG